MDYQIVLEFVSVSLAYFFNMTHLYQSITIIEHKIKMYFADLDFLLLNLQNMHHYN